MKVKIFVGNLPFLTAVAFATTGCSEAERFGFSFNEFDPCLTSALTPFSFFSGSGINVTKTFECTTSSQIHSTVHKPSGIKGKLGGERVIGESRRESKNARS